MDPDSNGRLQITVTDGRGRPIRDGGLSRWLAGVAPSVARGAVAIALVSDAHSRKLNSLYRRKNRPTDVLSFPADSERGTSDPGRRRAPAPPSLSRGEWRALAIGSRIPRQFLGDIVIATGTARQQAMEAGHSYQTELRVLALHGLLHLLGYDHEAPDDAGRMRRIEMRLRRRGRLEAGLIERS